MPSTRLNKFFRNLKYKYRLVIYNESTFETEYSFFLSKLNVLLLFSTMFLVGMLLTFLLITFTPLKYYLPGFGEAGVRKQLRELVAETDALRKKSKENDLWAENIKQVLSGKLPASKVLVKDIPDADTAKISDSLR